MARIQPYKRVVDAVFIHTSPALDIEIHDGMKIKEEPIDTTSNTDTAEDYTTVNNCLIDHDYHEHSDKSLSKNDISCKNINDTDNRHSNDETKTVNLERRNAKTKKEVHNTLKQFKKEKYSNEICNDKDTSTLCTTFENVRAKRKRLSVTLQHTSESVKKQCAKCDICFRTFSSFRNCEIHKHCYELDKDKKCVRTNVRKGHNTIYNCNFCSRIFKSKAFLQSHLFHVHNDLICFNNTIKYKTSKSKICKVNTSPKDDTLRTNEKLCLNNPVKSGKINTTNNVNKSCDDNVMNKSKIEKSSNNEMSPTKRLRQPTLTEYLGFCKKKHDIKLSPNKLKIMKDDFRTCALHHDEQIEENSRPKLSKGSNEQLDSLPTKSDNLPKQIAHSVQKQNVKHEACSHKKPFVKLHADVEMMKCFLENLSDDTVIKNNVTEDRTSDNFSYDRGIPYSLRSLSGVSSVTTSPNSVTRRRKNKNVSDKSRFDIEFSTNREQNTIHLDKVDWKVMTHFKCKECTIPLTRCDELPRNSSQISAIEAMKNTSLTTQCDFTLVQESDVQDKMMLKNLEVSLERLTAVPTTDIEVKTDVEKHSNDYFLCKVCKMGFSSKLDTRIHIKASHIAYMSSICNARYTLKHKLLEHYLCEHLFKQNQCCICYMLLPDYEALKLHLNVHCLKYVQRKDDQCPIDIELKCNLIKRICKCFHCDKTFSSQLSLMAHQNCCTVQKEMEEDQKNFTEEVNTHLKDIPDIQRRKEIDENTVTCDEKINPDDLCNQRLLNSDCVEKRGEHQISLHSEKEPKINEVNRNSLVNNNLIEKKIETVIESQDPKKLLGNNNSTISNQDIANTQLNDITAKMVTYPCDICGKQFHNSKNLQLHVRTFSFATDICPMCGTGFSSKRLLQIHITAAHVPQISRTYTFHCVFCNQGFFKKPHLRSHILHLHGQQVLNTLTRNPTMNLQKSNESITVNHTAICNVCNLVFETHDLYVEHRMYYYKNHTFTCSLCAQSFQGMYMLHHHNKITHYSKDKRKSYNYICDICNEGFNHESHFYSHNMHVHSKEVNLVETAKEFEDKSYCSSDVQVGNVSTNQQEQNKQLSNKYICQICQLKCIDMDDMVRHKEFHSNDGDFRCDKCNRRCRTFYLLDQHRKLTHFCRDVHNGHACQICDEVLGTVTALKCHEKHFHSNITGNNTDNSKNCSPISSNVTYKEIERPHESTNNTCNVTEYNCLFCDMKFSTPNTVQTHVVHVHMDDIIAKRATLNLALPIIDSDIQKQFVKTDQVPSASLSSSSSSSSSSSEDKSVQLLQRSTLQQSNNILSNTMVKNGINDKIIIDLRRFNPFTLHSKNKITEKTPILCINKSKDNISTCTIVSNTKPKTDILVSSATGSKTFRTVAPSNEFGNNTSVLLPTESTIKTTVRDTKSKDNTSIIPQSGSTNDLRKTYSRIPLKPGSINEFKTNSPLNRYVLINKSKTAPVYLLSTGSLPTFKDVMPQSGKCDEITNQKSTSVSSSDHGYSCPLCPLEYPSLMFFQAHLKYAHADSIFSIQTNDSTISQVDQAQKVSTIQCLLCPCTFMDETKYKKHLRNSHTYCMYIPNSEETKKINNVCNSSISRTNIKRKSTIPETITVEDDDDDHNTKNTSDQGATEVTATLDHGRQNEKIGKLRVKPFAKIIENLTMDSASKFL